MHLRDAAHQLFVTDSWIMVPWYLFTTYALVPIGNYGICIFALYKGYITFGSCMRQLFEGRRVLFIASGDLSHRLLPDAPADIIQMQSGST